MMQALFGGPKKSPQDQAKEWKRTLTSEARKLDTQIRKIQREEFKAVKTAKEAAKIGDTGSVRIISKEILHSRKAVNRLRTAKTQMNSVAMQVQMQQSQLKLANGLQKSAAVMAGMNSLMKINEISAVMQSMSKEMTKAGLIEEMMNDTIDDALDDVSEDELDDEVSKVVEEVMHGKMSGSAVGSKALPAQAAPVAEDAEIEIDDDADALMEKFNALKQGA